MSTIDHRKTLLLPAVVAALVAACSLTLYGQQATQATTTTPSPVIVQPKFGGQILGYDIDHNGTEGLLTESLAEGTDNALVATETFDQKTGKIIAVVAEKNDAPLSTDYAALYINADDLGLVLFQEGGQNQYLTLNPLTANQFTGVWTPTLGVTELSVAQGNEVAAFASFPSEGVSYVYSSNVAENTFGPAISLAPIISVDEFLINPVIALDSATKQAVLADSHDCPEPGPQCATSLALVNLKTAEITEFTDKLGVGQVNGLAVDPVNGIAVTTTVTDQGIEFYNLKTQKGFKRLMPNPNLLAAGLDLEFDAIHKVFLISQFSSTGSLSDPQPRVYVYNESGKLLETIATLQRIPISPNRIVLNPATRTGFMIKATPPLYLPLQLQSFNY